MVSGWSLHVWEACQNSFSRSIRECKILIGWEAPKGIIGKKAVSQRKYEIICKLGNSMRDIGKVRILKARFSCWNLHGRKANALGYWHSTKILREFYFTDWRFFVVLDDWNFCWELIFAILFSNSRTFKWKKPQYLTFIIQYLESQFTLLTY